MQIANKQTVRFKVSDTELIKLRNGHGRPEDGLHLIDKFDHHPGFKGIVRDKDGLGHALPDPSEDEMSLLYACMREEAENASYSWGV